MGDITIQALRKSARVWGPSQKANIDRISYGWLTVMSAPDDLKNLLGPNEKVELYIPQKIYHPKIDIDSVVITNERIILRHPHALGLKKDYTDYNYRDIANVVLDKGIMRSTIKLTLRFGGEPLSLNDLPNADAEKAYAVIRENVDRFQAPPSTRYTSNLPPR
jgi:hypothetical protein